MSNRIAQLLSDFLKSEFYSWFHNKSADKSDGYMAIPF